MCSLVCHCVPNEAHGCLEIIHSLYAERKNDAELGNSHIKMVEFKEILWQFKGRISDFFLCH